MSAISQLHPMEWIKSQLTVILDAVPPRAEIIYLDYPVYDNVGDLLIMKGTEAFFRDHDIRVRGRFSYVNFRSSMKIPEHWIVVCQGGGNFGDLYPHHQQLRESAVRAFPANRIVILPQTVHFSSPEKENTSFRVFAEHPDLWLFVRDENSNRKAARFLQNVRMAPDMAHQLYPLTIGRSADTPTGTLGLMRRDKETAERIPKIACDEVLDWPQLFSAWDRWLIKQMIRGYSIDRRLGNVLPLKPFWYALADRYVARAIGLFSGFNQIVTSRLHGHILSCLINKPNVLLDNNYGKNKGYYGKWTFRVEEAKHEYPPIHDLVDLHTQSS